jgi:hypothetical protein
MWSCLGSDLRCFGQYDSTNNNKTTRCYNTIMQQAASKYQKQANNMFRGSWCHGSWCHIGASGTNTQQYKTPNNAVPQNLRPQECLKYIAKPTVRMVFTGETWHIKLVV